MVVPSGITLLLEDCVGADVTGATLGVGEDVGVLVIMILEPETSAGAAVAMAGNSALFWLTIRLVAADPRSFDAVAPPPKPGAVGKGGGSPFWRL
jgi:hypothetical protein